MRRPLRAPLLCLPCCLIDERVRAMNEPASPPIPPPNYGGQAVIEGVMMRGVGYFAVACRRASGEIALTCEPVPRVLRPGWQKMPFLRGAFALVDAMALGTRSLFWAAKVAEEDTRLPGEKAEERASAETVGLALGTSVAAPEGQPADRPPARVTDVAIGGAMVFGLVFAIGLFKVLPQFLVEIVKGLGVRSTLALGLCDAALRLSLFFGYITLISRMNHVRRVFQYHGAEHKSINALEAGGPLTVETARAASRLHPRCGTSFVVIVMLLSVIAGSPLYGQPLWVRVPLGVLLLFPVAGVAYELLRLAGKYRANPVMAALSRPGMWTQLLTTREPDDEQLEVALASLRAVMDAENGTGAFSAEARQAAAVA